MISLDRIIKLALYGIFSCVLLITSGQNKYERIYSSLTYSFNKKIMWSIPEAAAYPVKISNNTLPLLTAKSFIAVDRKSSVALFEKNADLALPPASTTKIMTALVAWEEFRLKDIVKVKNVVSLGRIMGIRQGERITVENLLYGMLVHSANDAAYALADYSKEGIQGFVEKMNKKAVDLNLLNTHFTNPAGFDDVNHYMSARDLARLSIIFLENKELAKIVSTKYISVPNADFTRYFNLENVNELLGNIRGVGGLKTGYTEEAGQSLVVFYKLPQAELIVVLLGSQDRFGEMKFLLEYISSSFIWKDLSPSFPAIHL